MLSAATLIFIVTIIANQVASVKILFGLLRGNDGFSLLKLDGAHAVGASAGRRNGIAADLTLSVREGKLNRALAAAETCIDDAIALAQKHRLEFLAVDAAPLHLSPFSPPDRDSRVD